MQNLQQDLIELLTNEDNLVVDNQLNKNKIIEAALKVEPFLISLLIKNDTFKKHFFQEVENVLVFDKIKFQRFVNNKSFLPDSYTAFKKKIGLAFNDDSTDNFIKAKNDVVLAWPHKDCILEGGQTKEDQIRNEIFWNETLAPDTVDRLLDPKVLTNFTKFDKDGEHNVETLNNNENLILKGNNLLVISSLLKTHRGKIKMIYADPPYNTGNAGDTFDYNNTFKHSSWLTFMKNRLEVARNLLKEDGYIALTIDHVELFYLGVLADEVFGSENRVGVVTIVINPKGRQNVRFFNAVSEYMLVYAKNSSFAEFNKVVLDDEVAKTFNLTDEKGNYKLVSFIRARGNTLRALKPKHWYPIYVSEDLQDISATNKDGYIEVLPITAGKEYTWKLIKESFEKKLNEDYLVAVKDEEGIKIVHKFREQQVIKNVWTQKRYFSEFNGTNVVKELLGGNYFSYPKSIYSVKDTLKLMTKDDDIVLDFFGGSGTTAQAVLDLNNEDGGKRKFILTEQMNYIEDVTIKRVKKVIENNAQGSFIYAELMEYNQYFITKIQDAENKEDILNIWKEMQDKVFLSYQFNKDLFNERLDAFKTATLEQMQHYLVEVLDKNQLYVNFSEIEDETFAVSKEDKALNYSFYKENN
jgi:adenine-specific DNA-methyltransferase